jgi:hypothetical protein
MRGLLTPPRVTHQQLKPNDFGLLDIYDLWSAGRIEGRNTRS